MSTFHSFKMLILHHTSFRSVGPTQWIKYFGNVIATLVLP